MFKAPRLKAVSVRWAGCRCDYEPHEVEVMKEIRRQFLDGEIGKEEAVNQWDVIHAFKCNLGARIVE